MLRRLLYPLLALTGLLIWTAAAQADDNAKRYALTRIDNDYLDSQRESIDDLARRRLGRQINGQAANDIDVLQVLLDRRLVRSDDTRTLQAMGIVLGDLLAEELGLKWIIYEDRLGRSRALSATRTDELLFPVTMISRRAEADASVDVEAIYDSAVEHMQAFLPPKPFQY